MFTPHLFQRKSLYKKLFKSEAASPSDLFHRQSINGIGEGQVYKLRIAKILILFFCLSVLLFFSSSVLSAKPTEVYIFHMTGCGGCSNALRFLGALTRKYPESFSIKDFNLAGASQEVFDLYFSLGDAYNQDLARTPIPIIYLGEKSWKGYDTSVGMQIEQELVKCMAQGCISPINKLEKSDQKNQVDISTGGNTWLTWLILVVVLGVIIFVVIKISRR